MVDSPRCYRAGNRCFPLEECRKVLEVVQEDLNRLA